MSIQDKDHDGKVRGSKAQDLIHVFIFIVIIIIFHIFLVHMSSKDLNIDVRQRIILRNEGPIIHLKSPTKRARLYHDESKKRKSYWDISEQFVLTPYHMRFRPVKSWSTGMDDTTRWRYFLTECSRRNISESEKVTCAYDSEMFRRRSLIKTACKKNKDLYENQEIDAYRIFAMMDRRLVWCPVFKAASTNWMKNIPRLSRYSAEQVARISLKKKNRQANTLARAIVPYIPQNLLLKFMDSDPKPVAFIIVRNPFDRLLSAYRDKFERYNKYYYNKYGKDIVNQYRQKGIKKFGPQFYAEDGQNGSPVRVSGRKGIEPTFWEFIAAVLENGLMDEHWKPVIDMCSVCAKGMQFDFIIKFENLAAEEKYLTERLNIADLVKERWENMNTAGNTTQQIKDMYFNMLSEDEIWQLYTMYQMDFEMFGYEPELKYLIRYYDKTEHENSLKR